MAMTNLYIALSTHHVKYCEKIASERSADNNILITINTFEIDRAKFDRFVWLDSSIYNQSGAILSKIETILRKTATYRKAISEIEDLKSENDLTLYYSSLEDILSNYLFFYFSDSLVAVAIEDGVLNYYEHNFNDISKVTFYLKKLIALSFGLNSRSYRGHTSGIDYSKVNYQLVREPSYSIRPNKSRYLLKQKRQISSLNDDILIVGQEPYGSIFGKTVYIEKLHKLINFIKSNNDYNTEKKIFYKPHRHGPRIDVEVLNQAFCPNNVIYIEEELSMEELYFQRIKCKYIFTFDSSAVFSIYSDSSIELREKLVISVMPFHKSVLNELFGKLNFIILKDDI